MTALPKTEKSPALPDDVNDSNAVPEATASTCTALQVCPDPNWEHWWGWGHPMAWMGRNVLIGLEKSGCWLGSGMGREFRLWSHFPAQVIP